MRTLEISSSSMLLMPSASARLSSSSLGPLAVGVQLLQHVEDDVLQLAVVVLVRAGAVHVDLVRLVGEVLGEPEVDVPLGQQHAEGVLDGLQVRRGVGSCP